VLVIDVVGLVVVVGLFVGLFVVLVGLFVVLVGLFVVRVGLLFVVVVVAVVVVVLVHSDFALSALAAVDIIVDAVVPSL